MIPRHVKFEFKWVKKVQVVQTTFFFTYQKKNKKINIENKI